ncbi:hypothetical protein ABZ820_24895 [Streptomyces diacarni]|uniref:hypothetical protein n=1 Tax=Streptomyces diacarni TaxID=2800381 RepID=UPI0033D98E14
MQLTLDRVGFFLPASRRFAGFSRPGAALEAIEKEFGLRGVRKPSPSAKRVF